MPRFSGYGFPFQYYRPYNYNYRPRTPASGPVASSPHVLNHVAPHAHVQIPEEAQKFERSYPKKPKPDTPVWLDLFGIKLYFDDVLILSLLFFLYEEQVKDEGLFLALVMLLIS